MEPCTVGEEFFGKITLYIQHRRSTSTYNMFQPLTIIYGSNLHPIRRSAYVTFKLLYMHAIDWHATSKEQMVFTCFSLTRPKVLTRVFAITLTPEMFIEKSRCLLIAFLQKHRARRFTLYQSNNIVLAVKSLCREYQKRQHLIFINISFVLQ